MEEKIMQIEKRVKALESFAKQISEINEVTQKTLQLLVQKYSEDLPQIQTAFDTLNKNSLDLFKEVTITITGLVTTTSGLHNRVNNLENHKK